MCSSPNCALWLYPKFASSPTPCWLMPYVPASCQLELLLSWKRLPLETAQSGGIVSNTALEQPESENATIASGDAVETRTLRYCSGVPTRMSKLLHGPSLPSLGAVSRRRAIKVEQGGITSIDWQESPKPSAPSHQLKMASPELPNSTLLLRHAFFDAYTKHSGYRRTITSKKTCLYHWSLFLHHYKDNHVTLAYATAASRHAVRCPAQLLAILGPSIASTQSRTTLTKIELSS